MEIRIGLPAAVTAVMHAYSPDDDLEALAADRGIGVQPDETPEHLAARLSDTPELVPVEGHRELTLILPPGTTPADVLTELTRGNGIVAHHFAKGADGKHVTPEYVECESDVIEALLAEQFGCSRGRPEDVEDRYHTLAGAPGVHPEKYEPTMRELEDPGLLDRIHGDESGQWLVGSIVHAAELAQRFMPRLRTSAGRDFQAAVMATTGAQPAPANYIALTEDVGAPADGDTTLTGELAGSGWTRAVAVYAHVAGTTSYTLTKTFTSADGTPRSIEKVGVFNAGAAGSMPFESLVTSPPTLESGDQITVTVTVSLV